MLRCVVLCYVLGCAWCLLCIVLVWCLRVDALLSVYVCCVSLWVCVSCVVGVVYVCGLCLLCVLLCAHVVVCFCVWCCGGSCGVMVRVLYCVIIV